ANLHSDVRTHIFILPNNSDPGMIETLMQSSVEHMPAFECVRQFFLCTAKGGFTLPITPVAAKHCIQVYAATFHDIQMMPGIAASRDVFPFDNPIFQPLKDFLLNI